MVVHYKRARAAAQQLAWMMNVLAEVERIGGERKGFVGEGEACATH